MKWLLLTIPLLLGAVPSGPHIIAPGSISLVWDASLGATGYRLFVGPTSGFYTNSYATTSTNLNLVLPIGMYFFAVTATNQFGQSDYSNELQFPGPAKPQTNIVIISMSVEQTTNFNDWSVAWTYPDMRMTNPPNKMFYRPKLGISKR